MNNMGFFNPFGSSGSGGGGGGGSTANYSVKTFTDSSGQVSYKLTKNGTAVGDVISFNGSNMLVNYGGELVVLNSAIAGIEEALDKTYNFTTFTELGINTQNKTLNQLSAELAAKNLEEGTIVTGRIYSEALPYNNYGNAEVLVNNSILWWKTSSSTISPYSWNAIVAGNTVKMDWTPTYYQLPIASAQSLGGVKIGDNIQIAPDGTISVITMKGDTGTGIASIAKTSSSGLNDIYTITYTDNTTSTFTVTNGATITGGSIGQTGHLILTMSDGRTIDAGALPTDNEVEVTTTSSQPADPNVELWVDLSTQQTLDIPEINDSSTSSTQDTWSCKKIYDEQQRQEEEIGAVANAGAKNLLHFNAIGSGVSVYGKTYTHNGITYTLNDDMTISATGTADSVNNSYAYLILNGSFTPIDDYCDGKHIVSGCPADGSTSKYRMYVTRSGWGSLNETGSGAIIPDKGNYTGLLIACFVSKGYEIPDGEPLVFKPMIRPASITDGTFVPYALSNPVITPALIEQVDNGAKNKYPPFETQSSRGSTGVTYSYTNGIVHATGTKSGSLNYIEVIENRPISELGFSVGDTLILSNTNDSLLLTVILGDGTTFDPAITVGNGTKELTIGAGKTHIYIRSQVLASVTGTIDLSATPMICTKATWNVSHKFEPYALSNPTLTTAAIKTVDDGAKNISNWSASTSTIGNVTFTINSDKTVSTSGTATARSQKSLDFTVPTTLKAGRYVLSGCPSGGEQSGTTLYCLYLWDKTVSARVASGDDTGNGIEFDWIPDASHTYSISVDVRSETNASGLIFKPMICTAADWAVSQKFVPYLKPYSEIGRLGYHIETVALNNVTITKSGNGIFYTSAIDVSDKFDLLLGATLNNFGNLQSNIAIMPVIKPTDKTYSLWICDSTNPQTLPIAESSQVKVVLYGVVKG